MSVGSLKNPTDQWINFEHKIVLQCYSNVQWKLTLDVDIKMISSAWIWFKFQSQSHLEKVQYLAPSNGPALRVILHGCYGYAQASRILGNQTH